MTFVTLEEIKFKKIVSKLKWIECEKISFLDAFTFMNKAFISTIAKMKHFFVSFLTH